MLFIVSCNDEVKEETQEDALGAAGEIVQPHKDTMCFYRTEGTQNQDTAIVQLIFRDGDLVIGEMMHMPSEKDWRVGTLKGIKDGNDITAIWNYMQEGLHDSLQVVFRLANNKLEQKAWSFDEQTGREITPDDAQFVYEYTEADCDALPKHGFLYQ